MSIPPRSSPEIRLERNGNLSGPSQRGEILAAVLGDDAGRGALSADFTSQAVTPMTGRGSLDLHSWGPPVRDGGADLADAMMIGARKAFAEDREMIEAARSPAASAAETISGAA